MSEVRCSRCGRTPRREELQGFGQPLVSASSGTEAFPFESMRPWASIEGKDVCPDCQTAAERGALADRIVSMVEEEIARSRERGSEPLPHEAALIAFALGLRETSPPPPPIRHSDARRANQRIADGVGGRGHGRLPHRPAATS
jgi:hypothetical protein